MIVKPFSEVVSEAVSSGVIKNASQAKVDKDGYSLEYTVAGKKMLVVLDSELP